MAAGCIARQAATRCGNASVRAVTRRAQARQGRGGGRDTAQRAPRHNAVRAAFAQPKFRVCIGCTQPSFDSVHCSESLFGSLFMNTVHEVFKNIK